MRVMIKFSDFRGKNKFYKTRHSIGKNEALGQGGDYPSSNTTLNQTILGNNTYLQTHDSSNL